MNDYSYSSSGGCMTPILLFLLIMGGLLMLAGGDHSRTGSDTTPVLSGNEVFSRNQANIFSDVTNNYLDCMGAYSCVVTDNSTVITSTANTNTRIDGDRNTVGGVLHMCINDQGYGYQTPYPCQEGYTEVTP